jgi:hypothetical protein
MPCVFQHSFGFLFLSSSLKKAAAAAKRETAMHNSSIAQESAQRTTPECLTSESEKS